MRKHIQKFQQQFLAMNDGVVARIYPYFTGKVNSGIEMLELF